MTDKAITRQLFTNQMAIMDALASLGAPVEGCGLQACAEATAELMKSSALCEHDWDFGYSMNGPTRTCKLCGTWGRD